MICTKALSTIITNKNIKTAGNNSSTIGIKHQVNKKYSTMKLKHFHRCLLLESQIVSLHWMLVVGKESLHESCASQVKYELFFSLLVKLCFSSKILLHSPVTAVESVTLAVCASPTPSEETCDCVILASGSKSNP